MARRASSLACVIEPSIQPKPSHFIMIWRPSSALLAALAGLEKVRASSDGASVHIWKPGRQLRILLPPPVADGREQTAAPELQGRPYYKEGRREGGPTEIGCKHTLRFSDRGRVAAQ